MIPSICLKARGEPSAGRLGRYVGTHIITGQSAAVQAIAYIRICRPGSVIGPQQTFLHINEAELWKHGELYRQHQKVLPQSCIAPVLA